MRVRITRVLSGSIDGIQLDRFIPGVVYDVGTSIGSYLLSEQWAEPVHDESPALVVPLHAPMFHPQNVTPLPKAEASDRAPRKRARKTL
ncbi:MAG TPA: hypothetical protein VN654_04360 [Vicinamibacterales bacterium]|jgi:hypothetical protein|nr:hypothetical protein [Vicinamibacterales bacterium]